MSTPGTSFEPQSGPDGPLVPKEDSHAESCKCNNKRNLVVCISMNTNIVELYSRLVKDDNQLTFYNSGIGTYAEPSWKSLSYWKQVIANYLDLALALRFETILLDAYRWLSEMYQPGDRIFLFGNISHMHDRRPLHQAEHYSGFSRGAYQVRTLAGMIEKVGLIHKGNAAQIPFAYELYARSTDSQPNTEVEPEEDSPEYMPWRFKTTFSRKDMKVHFVGAWDTVSSIGFVRPAKNLPLTTSGMKHVCYFRHALVLDERRVKFLPEYAFGGASQDLSKNATTQTRAARNLLNADARMKIHPCTARLAQTKEVWFPGTHSDIGGGNAMNKGLNSYGPALRWMIHEAILAGLHVEPFQGKKKGHAENEKANEKEGEEAGGNEQSPGVGKANAARNIHESLTGVWWIFEVFPIRRLSYKDSKDTTHWPQMGAPRQVVEGQLIHESVYLPADTGISFKACLPSEWEVNRDTRRVDVRKIEQDLYNKVPENLFPLLERPQIKPDDYVAHLNALVEISCAPEVLCTRFPSSLGALSLGFSPDGKQIATGIKDGLIVWDARTGTVLFETSFETSFQPTPGLSLPYLVSFLLHIFFFLLHPLSLLLHPHSFPPPSTFRPPLPPLPSFPPSPPGYYLFPPLPASDFLSTTTPHSLYSSVAFSPDGSKELHDFKGHVGQYFHCVAFSPNGTYIVSGSDMICVWDAEAASGQILHILKGHKGPILSVAYSSDSKMIASGSTDYTVRLWNAETNQVLHVLEGHTSSVSSVAFSPTGTQVASGNKDDGICIWDTKTGKLLHVLEGNQHSIVYVVAYSPDSKMILSGSQSATIHVWGADSGQKLLFLQGHRHPVLSAVFSPDSKRVTSVSNDGEVRTWDLTGEWKEGKFLIEPLTD
ncbi:WD40 repeat-like protein [Gymnopus androsaceus JB14]|uniref:WD40 repeat-like protein n=1 Tax=Gymnopus androsaceus JB14 TaxID=1447944 RepID=A0A6A4HQC6_9AGAR|nr:WD40 repeat-like protein [Gymnopus androsaceus JB14]